MSTYARMPSERVDISELTVAICRKLGVDASYVYRFEVDAQDALAIVYCYAGRDGFCKGEKYIVDDPTSPFHGQTAIEPPLTVRVMP